MFLLVPADPGCPGQNLESHKMVVVIFDQMFGVLVHLDSVIGSQSQEKTRATVMKQMREKLI